MTTLRPSLTLSERYNNNVEASSRDDEASEDYETSINPQIALTNEWETLSVTGNYTLNSRLYSKDADRNYVGHVFSIDMRKDLTRNASLSASDSYLYTKDSREALDNQMELGRDTVITNRASLSYSYKFSDRTSSTIGMSQSTTLYDNEELFDDRSDSYSLSLSNRMSEFLTLNLGYSYTVFRYENGSDINDRETHSLNVGVTRVLARALSFSLNVGGILLPDLESDYDWTASMRLSKSWKITSLSLVYVRAVTNGSGLSAAVNVNDRGSMIWKVSTSRTTTLSISGSYSKNKSKDSDDIDNYSYSYGINGTWRLDSLTSLSLGFSRFEQKADDALTREVDSNTVYLSIALTPQGWRF